LVNGHHVGVTGRRREILNDLEKRFPGQVSAAPFDVTRPGVTEELADVVRRMGALDLFVYNAGCGEPSEVLDTDAELRKVHTNVTGFTECMCFAFGYFSRQGQGHIALTSSVAALRGNSWTPAYSASKAFMSNYAEGLRIKARKSGKAIAVTDIRPGFVATKMAKGPGQFWVAPPEKAARQIRAAIDRKARVAYVTRRWRLVALLLRCLPYAVYRRIA
jgi:short-subunit dehydrogenase